MYDEDNDELFAAAKSRGIWIRGLLTLLFLAILWFVRLIVVILAVFQFVFAIVTGGPNRRLLPFGRGVAAYMQQMVTFVTWNTETRPFPFAPWPVDGETSADDPVMETAAAPSSNWDEPFEPETVYEAPPPEPREDEAPDEPADEPDPKPRADGKKTKKKKKSAGRKTTPEDDDPAGDEVPGDD